MKNTTASPDALLKRRVERAVNAYVRETQMKHSRYARVNYTLDVSIEVAPFTNCIFKSIVTGTSVVRRKRKKD